ncbi:GerW family sporulation protein [Bacillus fonticola]|uniref:GerW family sporulation protein n=1 Tax=Bacillus fonticola TaxID=2728853 RepID=UPI0014729BC3|nr:GerW family sporulation protein [Bacillus fonticola]
MSDHPIKGLMTTAMENLKEMIDVNTIVGDPVETPDGSVILTVSKVGFGFGAGGSEFGSASEKKEGSEGQGGKHPFGGGSGGGVSITPIAFLVVGHNGVKMLHLDENTSIYERLLDLAPAAVEKIQEMLSKNKQTAPQQNQQQQASGEHKRQDLEL